MDQLHYPVLSCRGQQRAGDQVIKGELKKVVFLIETQFVYLMDQ